MVKKCLCGCGQEVAKEGNKYINGHNVLGRKLSEGTKKKLSEALKGNQNSLGCVCSEKTKRKMRESSIVHGKYSILSEQHRRYKKQECLFGCENTKQYDLHHEPKLEKNILEWEGRLINLCVSCHRKVHIKTLELPDNVGVPWTRKDTEKLLRKIIY